jgi:hypothetical protein
VIRVFYNSDMPAVVLVGRSEGDTFVLINNARLFDLPLHERETVLNSALAELDAPTRRRAHLRLAI